MGKKDKRKRREKGKKHKKGRFTAATADKHVLYELSVQNVVDEVKFLDATYRDLRGRPATLLREDFAGTTAAACEWVRGGEDRRAVAIDIDPNVLAWGRSRHVESLTPEQQQQIEEVNRRRQQDPPSGET